MHRLKHVECCDGGALRTTACRSCARRRTTHWRRLHPQSRRRKPSLRRSGQVSDSARRKHLQDRSTAIQIAVPVQQNQAILKLFRVVEKHRYAPSSVIGLPNARWILPITSPFSRLNAIGAGLLRFCMNRCYPYKPLPNALPPRHGVAQDQVREPAQYGELQRPPERLCQVEQARADADGSQSVDALGGKPVAS